MNFNPTIFAGDSSDALARVYAALPRTGLPDDARLEGELVGPYCRHSQTLPARIRFLDRGPGPTGQAPGRPVDVRAISGR